MLKSRGIGVLWLRELTIVCNGPRNQKHEQDVRENKSDLTTVTFIKLGERFYRDTTYKRKSKNYTESKFNSITIYLHFGSLVLCSGSLGCGPYL